MARTPLVSFGRRSKQGTAIKQRNTSNPLTAAVAHGDSDAIAPERAWTRRDLLSQSALGATLGTLERATAAATGGLIATSAQATKKPERLRPQPGDELVFAFGDTPHEPISATGLLPGAVPVLAVPREPATALVRDGSRLNNLAVVRIAQSALPLSTKTQRYAADDIIVFSAVCTHTGCTVEKWNAQAQHLICPCHQSEFKVADAARVINGPAPKPLAMLPVKVEDDRLVVNGKFSRRVGMQPQQ